MNRKEIYAKIKEYNLAEAIKKAFHENYTRIPSANLECFISEYVTSPGEEPEVVKDKHKDAVEKSPLEKLVETLQKKHILLKSEVDYIL
jgi:hypothetical protein